MELRRRRAWEVRLDISSLIDVVFLLLIFFAVSTTFLETSGIPLELPESTGSAESDTEGLTVVLSGEGEIRFRGHRVDLERLGSELETAIGDSSTGMVTIRADRTALHGRVVEIMDLARRSGAKGLTVATREPPDPGAGSRPEPGKAP